MQIWTWMNKKPGIGQAVPHGRHVVITASPVRIKFMGPEAAWAALLSQARPSTILSYL